MTTNPHSEVKASSCSYEGRQGNSSLWPAGFALYTASIRQVRKISQRGKISEHRLPRHTYYPKPHLSQTARETILLGKPHGEWGCSRQLLHCVALVQCNVSYWKLFTLIVFTQVNSRPPISFYNLVVPLFIGSCPRVFNNLQ